MEEPSSTRAEVGPAPAQAAAELCGWLEAGARATALLAPAGLARARAFDAVAARLVGRFAVTRLAGKEGESAESLVVRADAAARRAVGRAALLLVEDGELLSAAEALALRALADHAPGDLRLLVGLAPSARSAEVLRALGPGLERVTLGAAEAPPVAPPARPPRRVHAGALALAAGSIAAALALVVPRFGVAPDAPAPAPPPAVSAPGAEPPAVSAPPAKSEPAEVSAPPAPPPMAPAPRAEPGPFPESTPAEPSRLAESASPPEPRAAEPAPASAAVELAPAADAAASAPRAPEAAPARGDPPTAKLAQEPERAERTPPERAVPERKKAERAVPSAPPRPPPARIAASVAAPRPATRAAAPGRPAGGYLFVNAIPRADISVNGASAGPTPIVRFPLARGPHRVVALFADGRSEERRIDAVGAETYVVFGGTPR